MITIDELEQLAAQAEASVVAETERLRRLIRAYARILWVREQAAFPRAATERADEDGHYDNSYPPTVKLKAHNGPRLLEVSEHETEDVATSGGYYYAWQRVTTNPGLFVDRAGNLYGCDETGTGQFGQFAAHPGDCDVMCTLEYCTLSDVKLDDLRRAEETLRKAAFPLSQG